MKLSVAIITKNEERILEKVLKSVCHIADEIIILDSGSTDKTQEIAKFYNAKFYMEAWKGYGLQKNSVISKCSGDWILNIDADEEISLSLQKEISKIINNPASQDVYKIKFISFCFGKMIKYGGWSNFYKIRLFKKNAGCFNENLVHEEFKTSSTIGKIHAPIFHHTYTSLEEYFTKFNRYSTEGAYEYYKRHKNFKKIQIIIHPIFTFIKMYFLKLGFLDGIEGLLLACATSMQTMSKYYKLYEIKKFNKIIN